jgi:hypothetical protein
MRKRSRTAVAGIVSLVSHALLLLAILLTWRFPPRLVESPPVSVDLSALTPEPAPAPGPPKNSTSPPAAAKPAQHPQPVKHAATPRHATPAPSEIEADAAPASYPSLSNDELSGASSAGAGGDGAGGGGPGGGCNRASRIQAALRRDPLVQASIASLPGKAIRIWNGDWIWLPGEDGKGLTAVRQAMMWEIAFAPEPCRKALMHGWVLFSPAGGHGSARLAVGGPNWRWSDLLIPHPEVGG